MLPFKEINFKEPIIISKVLEDGTILVVDAKTTIRILNKETLEVISGFNGKITHLRYKNKVVDFSNNGKYFATLSADSKESRLYNVTAKKLVAKIDRHHGETTCVGIDPKCRYMFSCGDDGKVFVVDIKSGKTSFTIPAHADTINDIAFSSNSQWIATASYDKKIMLYNLAMMGIKHKLKAHSAPVMKVEFLSKHRLFSIDKNSKAIIWDVFRGGVIARLEGVHDDVTQVIKSGDDKFLFLGTVLGYLLVYDLDTYKLISQKYMKLATTITSLGFDYSSQQIIVGCQNGDLLFYPLYKDEVYVEELVQKHKYEEVEKFIDDNPLLGYTKAYEHIESVWDKTVAKATYYLQNNDKLTANKLLSNFKTIPSKNKQIQKIFQEYLDFEKFSKMAKDGKFALAYSIANAHPVYKESKIYKAMEAKWKTSFALAQKCSLNPKEQEKARQILAPYRGVSEKTKFIQEIFIKGNIYKRFRIALDRKEFKLICDLVKIHPFLKEFPEYDALVKYSDSLYIKSQKLIDEEKFIAALKLLKILRDFSDFSEESQKMINDISNKQKFFGALSDDDMVLAYTLLDNILELQETKQGIALQKQWNSDLDKASSYAISGDLEGVKKVLEPYMKMSSKYSTIATVFGRCYIVELEKAIISEKERVVIENGIKNYIRHFGLQDSIVGLFEIFKEHNENSKLELKAQIEGDIEQWKPSMIVNSILA